MISIRLCSGFMAPQIGFGTWRLEDTDDDRKRLFDAVKEAIEAGYRHFDTARAYENEAVIGSALEECMTSGKVRREDLFVTTKLANQDHARERVLLALKEQLELLKLNYIDLFLIHLPMGFDPNAPSFPGMTVESSQRQQPVYSSVHFTETWKGMEDCVRLGFVRSIGLSNFNAEQVEQIVRSHTIKPSVLQIEICPLLPQRDLVNFCRRNGIVVAAFSVMGSFGRCFARQNYAKLMDSLTVLIRYAVQRGLIVITKSTDSGRMRANKQWGLVVRMPRQHDPIHILDQVFDFQLTEAQMSALDAMETGERIFNFDTIADHPHFPF